MANLGTRIEIYLFAKKVGCDQFDNCYYLSSIKNAANHYKRYVLYKSSDEPSGVPPLWYGWLHYLSDDIPSNIKSYDWQKDHQPNLTGSILAYHPSKSPKNPALSNKYQAWQPHESNEI